jgi:hypothetical protein
VGSDDGITLVPAQICRAVLSCTTCNTVVAVGPPVTGGAADAAYLLGVTDGGLSLTRHFGVCAGGALAFTFEKQPPPAAVEPARARRHLRSVR